MKNTQKKIARIALLVLLLTAIAPASNLVYAQGSGTSSTGASQDTIEPSDVENLQATAGDSEVRLTWDAATDNVGVAGYKIHRGTQSVNTPGGNYNLPTIPAPNERTYTVRNLSNEQTYYFSVTAVDAASNESINYAYEVSATPRRNLRLASVEDDGRPPQVAQVSAEDSVTTLVVFSEPVRLPEEQPESDFVIAKSTDHSRLAVQQARVDERDQTGRTVVLTTAPQTENAQYVVTVGIRVEDMYGNPIISGTSDTGTFRGSGRRAPSTGQRGASGQTNQPPANQSQTPADSTPQNSPPAQNNSPSGEPNEQSGTTTGQQTPAADANNIDTQPPVLIAGSADYDNRMTVTFSEEVTLPPNPQTQFSITNKTNQQRLPVRNISLSVDGKTAYITTDPQQAVQYEVRAGGVTDLSGNPIAQTNSVTITGMRSSSIEDLIPPEDVMNLIARVKDAERHIVELQWRPSPNSAGDLADQLLYQSLGRTNLRYGSSTSLGTSTTAVDVQDLRGGRWYTFKLTAKDTAGNESRGAAASVFLPQTGPGMIAAGVTALFMGMYSRRKKRK